MLRRMVVAVTAAHGCVALRQLRSLHWLLLIVLIRLLLWLLLNLLLLLLNRMIAVRRGLLHEHLL